MCNWRLFKHWRLHSHGNLFFARKKGRVCFSRCRILCTLSQLPQRSDVETRCEKKAEMGPTRRVCCLSSPKSRFNFDFWNTIYIFCIFPILLFCYFVMFRFHICIGHLLPCFICLAHCKYGQCICKRTPNVLMYTCQFIQYKSSTITSLSVDDFQTVAYACSVPGLLVQSDLVIHSAQNN